ncbi:hypothetical protein AK812_SmicGene23814 [Symbiodinium microadriaticum]|uniref:Uncharacterized protein n=1 Tax=Symbiodinium microadriaticum TaxID=2951 RepID=A0A1Q9DG38_SYMMI|nr:hypothetical protein AK812_SmicGene23814 [Symbiodinium microadriaticum]
MTSEPVCLEPADSASPRLASEYGLSITTAPASDALILTSAATGQIYALSPEPDILPRHFAKKNGCKSSGRNCSTTKSDCATKGRDYNLMSVLPIQDMSSKIIETVEGCKFIYEFAPFHEGSVTTRLSCRIDDCGVFLVDRTYKFKSLEKILDYTLEDEVAYKLAYSPFYPWSPFSSRGMPYGKDVQSRGDLYKRQMEKVPRAEVDAAMEAAEGVIMDDEDDAETVAEPECDMDTESVEGVPGTEQTIEVDDDDDEVTDEEILNEPRNDRANVDPEGPFFWRKFRENKWTELHYSYHALVCELIGKEREATIGRATVTQLSVQIIMSGVCKLQDCVDLFCTECFIRLHRKGKRRQHVHLTIDNTGQIFRGGFLVPPEEAQVLTDRARSTVETGPWVPFRDDELNVYWYHLVEKRSVSQSPVDPVTGVDAAVGVDPLPDEEG